MQEDEYSKQLLKRVDEILYYLWDPIGVNDEPAARSEYANYSSRICSMLIEGKTEREIATRLNQFENDNMGLTINEKHALRIAGILKNAKHPIKENLS